MLDVRDARVEQTRVCHLDAYYDGNRRECLPCEEAPDWWSEALAKWTDNQRRFGKAFKKPASERSATEKTYVKNTTKRRVALLDGIGFFT